jgi:hypothetical protein
MTRKAEQWEENPEPDKKEMTPDRQTILETENIKHEGYLWESHNCANAWLSFDGKLIDNEP